MSAISTCLVVSDCLSEVVGCCSSSLSSSSEEDDFSSEELTKMALNKSMGGRLLSSS